MEERPRRDVSDGYSWWCRNCKTRKSIREGSFFSKSKINLQKWLLIIYMWARQYHVTDVSEEAEVHIETAIDIFQWLREVCSTKLLQTPIILGGPNVIVQIDESMFCHKPKNHRGRPPQGEVWVFGLADTSHYPALGYMEIVQTRTAATLLPIIQAHVAPGTIIHSDEWSSYRRVSSLPNVSSHSVVNHSVTFVNPTNGTHTQNIESYWNRVKTKLKRMKGCHAHQLSSYLDEFMWRERYGPKKYQAFYAVMTDIAAQYPLA